MSKKIGVSMRIIRDVHPLSSVCTTKLQTFLLKTNFLDIISNKLHILSEYTTIVAYVCVLNCPYCDAEKGIKCDH